MPKTQGNRRVDGARGRAGRSVAKLPGADLSGEELFIQVIPRAADEFNCGSSSRRRQTLRPPNYAARSSPLFQPRFRGWLDSHWGMLISTSSTSCRRSRCLPMKLRSVTLVRSAWAGFCRAARTSRSGFSAHFALFAFTWFIVINSSSRLRVPRRSPLSFTFGTLALSSAAPSMLSERSLSNE